MKKRIYKVEKVRIQYLMSNPPRLVVAAQGMANTSGWTNIELRPVGNSGGLYEFELVGTPPTGIVMPVLTEVSASYVFDEIPQIFDGVVVFAETNHVVVRSEKNDSNVANFEEAIPKPVKERLKGLSLKNNELTLRVPSNGCTSKEDFIIDINKGITGLPPYSLTVLRVHPDYCKALVPEGVEIKYSFEELGMGPHDWFSVTNQFQQ